MNRRTAVVLAAALAGAAACAPATPVRAPVEPSRVEAMPDGRAWWPAWRGPAARGVAPSDADPPLRWSRSDGVRWRVELPGEGHATPAIHGDRLFVAWAEPFGEPRANRGDDHDHGAHDNVGELRRLRLGVSALDRLDGRTLWQRVVHEADPHEGVHVTGSWASASPLTDGESVFVSFGSHGLFALDAADGRTRWRASLEAMRVRHGHGEGASPALYDGTLVVQHDHEGASALIAYDADTGRRRWRVARDEGTSWSTPLILRPDEPGTGPIVVTAATPAVRAYDLADGRELWSVTGLSRNVVASPVAGGGMLFAGNSYDTRSLLAIRLDEDGRAGRLVWQRSRDTPYVPSPVLLDDALCFLKHLHPILTCVEPETGAPRVGPWRVPGLGQTFASPVAAAGRLYLVDRDGVTVVVDPRPGAPRVLATNALDDSFSASPAVAGTELYLRGERALWCLGQAP